MKLSRAEHGIVVIKSVDIKRSDTTVFVRGRGRKLNVPPDSPLDDTKHGWDPFELSVPCDSRVAVLEVVSAFEEHADWWGVA